MVKAQELPSLFAEKKGLHADYARRPVCALFRCILLSIILDPEQRPERQTSMNPNANIESCVDPARLEVLFPPAVVLRSAPVRDHFASLTHCEQSLVAHAVERRRAEFSTGRVLAADGLRELGIPRHPIGRGSHNEPLWPPGIVGSISHSSGICIVVLASSNAMEFIGIDVESCTADVTKIGKLIMTPRELQRRSTADAVTLDERTRVTFCAKEAVFKAIFPLVARFVDFQEVALTVNADTQTFEARACKDDNLDELLRRGIGRFGIFGSALISSFFCEAARRA